MKVEDLKTGMRLTFKNGETAIVLRGTTIGDIYSCIGSDGAWGLLNNFTMRHDMGDCTVIKVENANNNYDFLHEYKTIWERKEVLEVSIDEIAEKFGIPVKQLKIKK